MVETIKKRNGVVVAFDAQKIYNAIFKANIRIADEKLTEQQLNALTKEIVSTFQTTQDVPTVEPVSYTHLDVYKRQPLFFPLL